MQEELNMDITQTSRKAANNILYGGYDATGNVKVDKFYEGLSSAANKAEGKSDGKLLGLTTLQYTEGVSYGMVASYSSNSTEEDPIIMVSCNYGGYDRFFDVHVKDVNPANASVLEMFALCSYTDNRGITDNGTYGSFIRMKHCVDNDALNNGTKYIIETIKEGSKLNWLESLMRMAQEYLTCPATYEQYLDTSKLLDIFSNLGKYI